MPPIVPRARAELDLPEGFLFLFSFDYHSVFERKNPLAVIDAFTQRLRARTSGAVLVSSRSTRERDPARTMSGCWRPLGSAPDVHVIDGYLSP